MMIGGMMYSKGDIVIVSFPYSDLINAKKRPMLVLATKGDDILGCAITSNPESEGILLKKFSEGELPFESKVKYWQIITFIKSVVLKKVARLSNDNYKEVTSKINDLIKL